MDLQDLRSFIATQKLLVEQERKTLSKRFESLTPPTAESNKGCPINNDSDVSRISEALSERISNLSQFRDDICPVSNTDSGAVSDLNGNDLKVQDSSSADLSADKVKSKTSVQHPFQTGIEANPQDKIASEKEVFKDIPALKGFKIEDKPSVSCQPLSREEQVARLQDKFSSAPFWDDFGRSATGKRWRPDTPNTMVRIGEFSPANPDLQAPGKTLLGLGEYEERRRQLLEKKKQEYKDYLSQHRNALHKTDHLHPSIKSYFDASSPNVDVSKKVDNLGSLSSCVDAGTQTDTWLVEQSQYPRESDLSLTTQHHQSMLSPGDPSLPQLSPREKHNMELQHHCAPCFVPRAHASQTTEQLPDVRMRQLQLQEELRMQIEEKRRLEAERREQERREEEALQKRVAEQQARLQAEYERDEKLRLEREIRKQQQMEDFQKRQEELKAESEALKQEERERRQMLAKVEPDRPSDGGKAVAPVRSPVRSPRRENPGPPSPRALIKVLEGPTLPRQSNLEDSLPIPLMPVMQSRQSRRSPHVSPHRHISPQSRVSPQRQVSPRRPSPHQSPHHSPSRFISVPSHHHTVLRGPSEAMRNLEERWKVPAVQKNVCTRGKPNVQDSSSGNVLTQLGAFRRQLQMEHIRMEEKVKERHKPHQYDQQYFQQHIPQRSHNNY